MGLRQQWEERELQWQGFHEWEGQNLAAEREPSAGKGHNLLKIG